MMAQTQQSKELHFKIDEESPPNSYIGLLEPHNCGRSASPVTGKYTNYRLVSENTIFLSHIDIDQSSGKMTLRHSIDRDSMCEKMLLCCNRILERAYIVDCVVQLKALIQSIDVNGNPGEPSDCNVNIEISDINDHSPMFSPDKYVINISEIAMIESVFPLPLANDADSSKFSVSRYYLKEPSRFFRVEFNQDNAGVIIPKLIIKSRLDREEISEHQLLLISVDTGLPPKSGSLNLIVRVLDENDNEPVIEQLTPLSIKEDVPVGQYITKIQALDKDAGENALLYYNLKEYSSNDAGSHFKINHVTGEITTTQKIDYDSIYKSPQIELVITVKDHGKQKSLSSSSTLTINIVDVNDEVPKISIIDLHSRQPARPEIRENLVHNQFVAFVNVRDDDHGINGQIKCDLLGDQSDFSLENIEHNSIKDRYEFKIITKARLDCEKQSIYKLQISCNDLGHPKLSSQAEIMVKVLDINDNTPSFGQSRIELELEENQPQGTLVATLNVTDLDETDINNGQFEYVINDSGKKYFRIEPIEGRGKHDSAKLRIYTLHNFDREKVTNVEFELIVKDVNWGNGIGTWQSLSSTSIIVVNIVDVNDNAPMFSKSQYEFTINEEKAAGQFVGLIQATDEDQGNNGKIVYKIEDYSNSFLLDLNTGTMMTRTKIDREKVALFEFKVKAIDLGRTSRSNSVNVVVKVNDINDNDPKFIYPTAENHTVLASVFNSEGSLIMKVNAIDNDEAGKNQVTYVIDHGDDTSLFQIDPTQGGISFTRKPKNTDAKSYFITIKVSDNDYPIRHAKITIHIKLDESRLPFLGQDFRRGNNQGDPDEQSWIDSSNRSKFPINRNILLVICLIVISVTLAGVLLMLIICLKKRPLPNVVKTSQQIYEVQNENKLFRAYKNNSTNASNMTLNYRMVPTEKYQDLVHDSSQSGYSGLSFFRKNTNINRFSNDPAVNFMNNTSDGYQWINNSNQTKSPLSGDSSYHKITSNIDMPAAITRKALITDQISSTHDETPSFLSNYVCGTDQLVGTHTNELNDRYQTLDASGKSGTLTSTTINEIDKSLFEHSTKNFTATATPKRSLIASSFV